MNSKKLFMVLFAFFCSTVLFKPVYAKKIIVDENTGVSGTFNPTIPEPLNFDLVRPLGAKKGEIEINILGLYRLQSQDFFEWGPEIEVVIENGLAMEFELPFNQHHLEELKFAFQGTITDNPDNRFIHGWQTIQRAKIAPYFWQSDYLYIHAYKFNQKWSTLSLTGFRQSVGDDKFSTSLLNNTSFFRRINSKMQLGLEANWQLDKIGFKDSQNKLNLIPQLHYEIGDHYSVQLGLGVTREDKAWKPLLAIRMIIEI